MGGGGGSTSNTTNTVAEPWKGQQPYLKDVFSQAQGLYNSGGLAPEYYSGNTLADQSGWTQQANQMQADRALNGDASITTAKSAMDNITSGQALAGNTGLNALNQMTNAVNPYSSALLKDAIGSASADIDSGFSSAGRYGSGAHENAKADSVADLTSAFYSDAYDKQMQAAQAAGDMYNTAIDQQVSGAAQVQELSNQAYKDAAALSEAGANLDAFNQAKIDAEIDRYNYNSQIPLTALSNYNQLIQGTYGGTSTSTAKQDYKGSPLGTAVGAGAAGLGLANELIPGGIMGLFS